MLTFGVFREELGRRTGFQVVEVDGPNDVFLLFNYHFAAGRFFYWFIYDSSLWSKGSLRDVPESFQHLAIRVQLINDVKGHCLLLIFKQRRLLLLTLTIHSWSGGVIGPNSGYSIHSPLNIQLFNPLGLSWFDICSELAKALLEQLVLQILGMNEFEAIFYSLTEKTISGGLRKLLIYILGCCRVSGVYHACRLGNKGLRGETLPGRIHTLGWRRSLD